MSACILLAGGRGTRLRDAVPDLPKCLAPVGAAPFLEIQMERLAREGVERFILSLGYRADQVIEVARRLARSFPLAWVVEPEPLGTGGAALFALHGAKLAEAWVANADTLLEADLGALAAPLDLGSAEHMRLLAVRCPDAGRFGAVVLKGARVERFLPRGAPGSALVSAGVYRVHRNAFAGYRPGEAFSLEADVMPRLARHRQLTAAVAPGRFVDIGEPGEYYHLRARYSPA